ncbi:MAG: hypothetical protein HUJ54_15075, partial [Erysipelotrichaceae bacterium]|nr:hypothetical protein [Erysipelotrichaceae bacterium]
WGLGKTVYFRIGDGLVLYYSRIREDGIFQSRLAACMVEDEQQSGCVIPRANDWSGPSGIAWWGEQNQNFPEEILPLTGESDIREILDLFGIPPFEGEETGTVIIIPYINEEKLLEHNRQSYHEEDAPLPYWYRNIETYLEIALQRWYAPRLDNQYYTDCFPDRARLEAFVNGKEITTSVFAPVFRYIQKLYNKAIGASDPFLELFHRIEPECLDISTKGVLEKSAAGTFCFYSFTREQLQMNAPDNLPDPYTFTGIQNHSPAGNSPIVTYVRKPGMIINYENSGPWVYGVPATEKDTYLIGVFALASDNVLKKGSAGQSLEEYVRLSEKANHRSWNDHDYEDLGNPGIISRIQKGISGRLRMALLKDERKKDAKVNQTVGKKLAALYRVSADQIHHHLS